MILSHVIEKSDNNWSYLTLKMTHCDAVPRGGNAVRRGITLIYHHLIFKESSLFCQFQKVVIFIFRYLASNLQVTMFLRMMTLVRSVRDLSSKKYLPLTSIFLELKAVTSRHLNNVGQTLSSGETQCDITVTYQSSQKELL